MDYKDDLYIMRTGAHPSFYFSFLFLLKDLKRAFCKTLDLGNGHYVLLDERRADAVDARAVREYDLVNSNTVHAGIGGVGKIVLGPSRPAEDVLRSLKIGQNFTATENAAECVPVEVNVNTMRPDVAAYVAHIDASKQVDVPPSPMMAANEFAIWIFVGGTGCDVIVIVAYHDETFV